VYLNFSNELRMSLIEISCSGFNVSVTLKRRGIKLRSKRQEVEGEWQIWEIKSIFPRHALISLHRQKCEGTRQGRIRWTITTLGKKLNLKIKYFQFRRIHLVITQRIQVASKFYNKF
jgi:hypothetical protein